MTGRIPHVISLEAIQDALDLGLTDDTESAEDMLDYFMEHAALVTHEMGNRRFGGYVLNVEERRTGNSDFVYLSLTSICKMNPDEEVCFECYGTERSEELVLDEWVKVPCKSCTSGYSPEKDI